MIYGEIKIWNESSARSFIESLNAGDYFFNILFVSSLQKNKIYKIVKFDFSERG